jgi:hypothetical protein
MNKNSPYFCPKFLDLYASIYGKWFLFENFEYHFRILGVQYLFYDFEIHLCPTLNTASNLNLNQPMVQKNIILRGHFSSSGQNQLPNTLFIGSLKCSQFSHSV